MNPKVDDTRPDVDDESEAQTPTGGDVGSRPDTARSMGRDPRTGHTNDRDDEDDREESEATPELEERKGGGKRDGNGNGKAVKESPDAAHETSHPERETEREIKGGRQIDTEPSPRDARPPKAQARDGQRTQPGAQPVKYQNTVDATRGEPLATRAIQRRAELEEILLDTQDVATRYDIELALSAISQLLTGDLEHLSEPTAVAINHWLEGSKHLGETPTHHGRRLN